MKIGIIGKGRLGTAVATAAGAQLAWQVGREGPREAVDVAIDCSRGEVLPHNLQWALRTGSNLLIGTTGWQIPDLGDRVRTQIGVLTAPNFSLAVALMARLATVLGRFAQQDPQRDLFLVEHHHAAKTDAPSGTALLLLEALRRGCPRKTSAAFARDNEPLRPDQLSVASIRAGRGHSSHTIGVELPGEGIELSHAVHSYEPFAHGALAAARFLCGKKGLFTMNDVAANMLRPLFEEVRE